MAAFKGDARDAKRARHGARVQEEMKEAFERKVEEMRRETEKHVQNMGLSKMFTHQENISEKKFKDSIVGLQSHEEYKNKLDNFLKGKMKDDEAIQKKSTRRTRKLATNLLSFDLSDNEDEEDDEESEPPRKRRRIMKNPNVDTSFLPDVERDEADAQLRDELAQEWTEQQKKIKRERLEITYSYWDGSGHRRTIEIVKGMKIGEFLELCRKELAPHFSELRGMHGDHLMYIKDDLIIPHSFSFYDLIVTGAKGLSKNYMFKNESYDKGEYRIERDGGHPGKVITRAWYDRNKHIFPASRWEVYDPAAHNTPTTDRA